MEESFIRVINELHAATGKMPKRIEMEGGEHILKYRGVEFLLTTSQYSTIWLRFKENGVLINDK